MKVNHVIKYIGFSIFLCLLATSCNRERKKNDLNNILLESKSQNHKLFRFYDFNLYVTESLVRCGDTNDCVEFNTKYILCNYNKIWNEETRQYEIFEKNTLYQIISKYRVNSTNRIICKTDTLKVSLKNEEMNKLYSFAVSFFQLTDSINVSLDSIPPPPPCYDGPHATISLNLGYRGDSYSTKIGIPDDNPNYIRIIDYLKKLVGRKE